MCGLFEDSRTFYRMKMASKANTLFVFVFLLSTFYECSAINCFYCNSANNSACLDFTLLDEELLSRTIPVVNCEASIPSPVAANFFCRKIVQTIFHSHRDAEVRVTRGCGWVRHHSECYRADNMDHLETVCQCFHDHCNSGNMVDPSTATGLFLVLACVLYFMR